MIDYMDIQICLKCQHWY